MINFFVKGSDSTCMREYLQERGRPIADRVAVYDYERMDQIASLPAVATIFAGLDRATAAATNVAAQIYDQLARAVPAPALLNDPRKALGRFDLLRKLHEAGCNGFTAIRAWDDPDTLRLPVFIRRENDHAGSLTPLLHDRRAIARSVWEARLRGIPLDDLLIVEFCDTRGDDRLFRKYSAMRIGDTIVPRHLHVSGDWVTKAETALGGVALIAEERRYLEGQVDDSWLRDVFDLAQIEYGRIDYALYRGEPQVWEINTNPTLGRRVHRKVPPGGEIDRKLRAPGHAVAHQRMLAAFTKLDTVADPCDLPVIIRSENARLRGSAVTLMISRLAPYPRVKRLAKRFIYTAAAAVAPVLARTVQLRRRKDHREAERRGAA